MQIIQLTPKQWAAVRDNPVQRDTIERANKAIKGDLAVSSPTQQLVAAAMMPDTSLIKLDGHTRAALWDDGRLPPPEVVHCAVYPVETEDDAIVLYKQFDSPDAVENAHDRLAGAYRLNNMHPQSPLLTRGGITAAFNIINNSRVPVYTMVGMWKKELEILDRLDSNNNAMPTVLIAAALLTFRKRGDKALPFWTLYVHNGGMRVGGANDGVQELRRIMDDLRAKSMLSSNAGPRSVMTVGRAISCVEAWLANRSFTVGVRATELQSYVSLRT